MRIWAIVLLAGVTTLAIRLVPVVLISRRAVPEWLDRIGSLTAPVAFAALGASTVASAASGGPGELLPLLAAVGAAGLVAIRTRSTAWAIGVGMLTVWTSAALFA